MFEKIADIVVGLFETKTQKLLLTSILASALLAGLSALAFGFHLDNGEQSFTLTYPYNDIVVFFLFVSWLPIFLLLYILRTKEAEDLFSYARTQLIGDWTATYDVTNGIQSPALFTRPAIACGISVNPENQKLEFNFKIRGNPVYEDCDQIIQRVAIRHDEANQYMLMYYYRGARPLQFEMARYIKSDPANPHPAALPIEIVGILTFKVTSPRKKITEMSGEWYDLNGNITKLHALIDAVRACPEAEREHFSRTLSDIDIHHGNFSANMGRIEFSRVQA